MKSFIRVTHYLLFLMFCIPTFLFAADDPPKDPFLTQGVSKDAPPINTVSEHVDPFSGIISLSHTDLHLPGNGGLDLNLVRTYNSMIWGRRDTSFPGLIAQNERSPLGIGWSMHMGIVRNPFGTGSSNRYVPDNPVVEMPDGSKHVLYKDRNDSSRFISKDFWVYKLVSGSTGSGTWELTLADGTIYTFEYGTGKAGYNTLSNPLEKTAQVTKIRNAANTAAININYYIHANGYSYLKTITDSANRTVTLNYDYTNHRLTSITVDNRTFSYAYTTMNSNSYLTTVTPPVGNAWSYEYESAYELNAINSPTGGRIAYTYSDNVFKTGPANVSFRVITGRTTSGRGITGGTWTYSYSSGGSSGDITTIAAPGVTETHKFYGWGNNGNGSVWKIGLPMSKEYSGAFSMSETYSWSQGTSISNDQISNAGWTGTIGQVYDLAIYAPFLASKAITRDSKTYTTNYSDFDAYGNPKTTSETGDISRSSARTYWTNTAKNIVANKPASETVTGGFAGTSTTSWTYDTNSGNVTQLSRNGVITNYGYDANGNLSSITDANQKTTTFLWSNGRISKKTNPIYAISRVIDANGTIASETNGRNYKTTFSYDNNLRLTKITPPIGNATSFTYPADSSNRKETRGGYSITYNFDGFGRPTGSSDTRGLTTSIVHNAYGAKDYSDSSTGDKVYYDYFGRIKQVLHKDNKTINSTYSGSNVTVVEEDGQSTSILTYNAFGNPEEKYLVSVRDQATKTATYSRNILGLLTGISQPGVTRSYSYNSKYFLTSETNPETGTITYGRDNVGNMTSQTDSTGTKNYTYDGINRLTKITSGTNTITYGYDNADNRTSMASPSASNTYGYDSANRLTTKTESIAGRSYTTSYGYDGNDNITAITYPSSRVVNSVFNGNNQATSITGFVTNVSYSTSGVTAGLPTAYSLSNGISTVLSYNNRQAVTGITAGSALSVGYGFDSRGNTTSITNNLDTAKNQSFTYDSLSRVTGFNGTWGSGSFTYDAVGNRTEKTVAGANTSYGYTSNRLTSTSGSEPATFSYNGNGALTGTTWGGSTYSLIYDGFDNLASYQAGTASLADFGYDGDGMRVTKTSGGKTIVYHYDQGGKVISENYSDGRSLADYIHLNGKLIAKVAAAPTLSVAPTSDSFGNAFVGSVSPKHTFTLNNSGNAYLVITSVGISGTNNQEFLKSDDGCTGLTLAPSGSCIVQVYFSPASTGAKTANLAISSNDPFSPVSNVSLNGVGSVPRLSITTTGTGSGIVTSNPAGISCGTIITKGSVSEGTTCSENFTFGSSVHLIGIPSSDSTLSGWSGGECNGIDNCVVTINADTNVTAIFNKLPPVANFTLTPNNLAAPGIVNLTSTSQYTESWLWDFGDGTTSTLENPSHTYRNPGTYSVTLTVTNASGSDTSTLNITVTACSNHPAYIEGKSTYSTLQATYDAAADGDIIRSLAMDFTENLTANRNISVTIDGGYMCDYSAISDMTVIVGGISITSGTVKMKSVFIRK